MSLPNSYDSWRLDTPPHYDEPDIYESDLEVYHHYDENVLSEFERKVKELADHYGLFDDAEKALEHLKGE